MRLPAPSWTFWSTALLFTTPTTAFLPLRTRQAEDIAAAFDWASITPTPDLQYHPCYDTFQCARLRVPLDWSKEAGSNASSFSSSSPGPYAAIAIVTLPATVPVTDPAYAGPILINPGGPAGSGTDMALGLATVMQGLVDVPGVRHYDLLGFDPRGVRLSTPSGSCYASQFNRAMDAVALRGMPTALSEQGLQMRFGMNRAVGELCDGDVFRHLSTASVARDMLEIVDRSHELVVKAKGAAGSNSTASACGGNGEKPRLQYMGFSYGTFLGNTFASMFPGRVGRMLVDGVVDGADYTAGTWEKNIGDADASVDIFYRTCFDSEASCPLRQSSDTSFTDIRTRVDALLSSLREAPVMTVYNDRVYTMTSYLLGEKIRTSLYAPIQNYEPLAISLAEALVGNFSSILADQVVMGFDLPSSVCTESSASDPADPPQEYNFASEVSRGIICGDSQASAGERDLAWAADTVARITNQSSTIGEAWTNIPLACADWPFTPPYAFAGPFGSKAPDNSSNTPAAPLLILSTKTDHATPLENAYSLSRLHEGSSVAMVDAVGHCALLATTSSCIYGIVQEYFHTGKVPVNGTVCEAECVPEIPFKACPGLP
ncbi:TAP-like protein-domain-containing protein [Chaetomium fimeti]|uniref:TAP-like protein-domain-containing protein n=1 Tax=Chaetomium fimeti TaxID=1854472 RepID=A0AAE0H5H2_9PEZI|nr:TAP-like protein-domain-containing protein [Chaetomium fimeti]